MKQYKDHAAVTGYFNQETVIEIPEFYDFLPVTEIESAAFENNPYIEKVYLPDTVTVIGDRAFHNCTALNKIGTGKDLDGPVRVVYIGRYANVKYGDGCNSSVFPAGIKEIGYRAFAGTRLEDIFFRSLHVSLDNCTFEGCRSLNRVIFRIGVDLSMGHRCFKNSGMTHFCAISQDPIYVQSEAFMNCFQLNSVHLRAWAMGTRVFAHCYNLRFIGLSDRMTAMLQDCFLECYHLDTAPYLPFEKKEADYTEGEWLEADLDD